MGLLSCCVAAPATKDDVLHTAKANGLKENGDAAGLKVRRLSCLLGKFGSSGKKCGEFGPDPSLDGRGDNSEKYRVLMHHSWLFFSS